MLHFKNFHKSYGSNTILQIDDFTITPGIYWLRGPNGSGKSTLLKSIGGLLFFDGELLLDHTNLKRDGINYKRSVNFGDAEPMFPEFLTGNEMITLFEEAKKAPPKQGDELIEGMNMQSYLGEPLGSYSSGMLKKLSLVLAFLGNPKFILLDEPLNTIDHISLAALYRFIKRKHEEEEISFLLSSHQPLDQQALPQIKELLIDQQTINLLH
ncbi:MAG TPA: ABC transporter ATP-binding protein [Pseudosphingobacterium sp.]|nr:ABC transporter ATP-binding protein [Pseudosphingobacterium sp.]